MSDMVEKIGDAAVAALIAADFECGHMTDRQKTLLAFAVLKTMFTPDGDMMRAGMKAADEAEVDWSCTHLEVWQAMIEAALMK
jgi:hypothetical protein